MGKAKSRRQKYHASAARGKNKNSAESPPVDPTQPNDIEMAAGFGTKVQVDLLFKTKAKSQLKFLQDCCPFS